MRVRRSLLALASAAALAAVVFFATPATAATGGAAAIDVQQQQRSLFHRAAQAIQGAFLGGQQQQQSTVAPAETEPPPKLEDPWETQRGLKMVRKLLDGDQLGVVLDMAQNPELEQVWSNPRATFRLLQSYPMLGGIRGVKDIMAKSEAEITPEDGLSILRSLRQVATVFVKISAQMADPEQASGLFEAYAAKLQSDPGYTALLARIDGGDRAAANELQQRVADEAWGGLIDLDEFGLNGAFPPQLAMSRDTVLGEEPAFFELVHQNDPFVKGFLQDPTSIYKVVQDAIDSAGVEVQ